MRRWIREKSISLKNCRCHRKRTPLLSNPLLFLSEIVWNYLLLGDDCPSLDKFLLLLLLLLLLVCFITLRAKETCSSFSIIMSCFSSHIQPFAYPTNVGLLGFHIMMKSLWCLTGALFHAGEGCILLSGEVNPGN